MSTDLIEEFTSHLTRLPHVDADSSYADIIANLFAASGFKQAAAAREIGINPTTFYRNRNWALAEQAARQAGLSVEEYLKRHPSPGIKQKPKVSKAAMVAALRRMSVSAARKAKIATGELKLALWALMGKSQYWKWRRPAKVGNYFPPGVMAPVLDAWLKGDDDLADGMIRAAVREYYEDLEIAQCIAVRFDS